jgi:glutathione S-transferase
MSTGKPATLTVIGSFLSPYVRKVLACLTLKDIAWQIDPMVPFFGNDEFSRLSPLRRVPVLIDGEVTLADSTVICEYLDERYPGHPLLPRAAADRARARWLEEYADSRMGEVFIWRLFNQVVINRHVWRAATDEAVVRKAVEEEIPQILDYLENELPPDGWLFGGISVADITIAAFFRNATFAGFETDADRWPTTDAFVRRTLEHPALFNLRRFEELSLRTPPNAQRESLRQAGARVAGQCWSTSVPRRGVLSI